MKTTYILTYIVWKWYEGELDNKNILVLYFPPTYSATCQHALFYPPTAWEKKRKVELRYVEKPPNYIKILWLEIV